MPLFTNPSAHLRLPALMSLLLGAAALAACAQPAPATPAATTAPAAAATTTAPTAAAGTPKAAATPAVREPSGRLTVSINPWFVRFDPSTNAGAARGVYFWPVYDGVTWIDREGTMRPGLATSWSSPDGRTWTFRIRNDIRFHDGTPLEARDIAGTWNFYRNPANQLTMAGNFIGVTSVTAPDPTTVVVTSSDINPTLPKILALALVMKGRDLENATVEQYNALAARGIGTGPYRFTNVQAETALDYEAMPSSFVTPRGTAPVRHLSFRNLPEASTQVSALTTGEINVAYPLSGDSIARVRNAGLSVENTPAVGQTHLVLNTMEGPGADVRVRRAMNHAINKQAIIDTVLGGFGSADAQLIGPEVLGYNRDLRPYAFDPARARQLLAEAGFPNGLNIGIFQYQQSGSLMQPEAEAIAADLQRIGITSRLESVAQAVWTPAYRAAPSGRSPIWPGSTSWDQTFDAQVVYRWWSSDTPLDGGRRWMDPQFDSIYQRAKVEVNPDQRARLFREAAAYLHDQAAVVFLWRTDRAAGFTQRVLDWKPGLFADMFTSAVTMK